MIGKREENSLETLSLIAFVTPASRQWEDLFQLITKESNQTKDFPVRLKTFLEEIFSLDTKHGALKRSAENIGENHSKAFLNVPSLYF